MVQAHGIVQTPCRLCGKTPHADYLGLCMDCADSAGISEVYTTSVFAIRRLIEQGIITENEVLAWVHDGIHDHQIHVVD
ncbi:MAG: hypothetical protein ACRD38_04515 [Nitrososphaerales archaeon]